MATAVPVASLLWASAVARTEVEHRALAGLEATAKATVLQEQQAWDDAVLTALTAASRPVPLSAVQSRDVVLAERGAQNILSSGPFTDVRILDRDGNQVASAAIPGVTPTPVGVTDLRAATFGVPVSVGARTARQVAVPLAGRAGARLIVDIDMTEILGRPTDLAFGRTGAKLLVSPGGMVLAGSTAVGTRLRANPDIAIAAENKPVTTIVADPGHGRATAESYQPIPPQNLGIFVQQSRSEVMGGADRLAARMRLAAAALGALGAGLAAFLGVFLARRSRRLASIEKLLSASQAESRRRLEQFLDAMPIGVFVATPDGVPYYANREAVRLLGRGILPEAGAGDGTEVYEAYVAGTGDRYPAAAMPLVRALRGETSHADDIEIGRPDAAVPSTYGERRCCQATGTWTSASSRSPMCPSGAA